MGRIMEAAFPTTRVPCLAGRGTCSKKHHPVGSTYHSTCYKHQVIFLVWFRVQVMLDGCHLTALSNSSLGLVMPGQVHGSRFHFKGFLNEGGMTIPPRSQGLDRQSWASHIVSSKYLELTSQTQYFRVDSKWNQHRILASPTTDVKSSPSRWLRNS